jgi:hypothetical protein
VTEPWQRELRDSLLIAVYVALTGPLVGLLWWQAAPKLTKQLMAGLLIGSNVGYRTEIGADAWFLLFAAVAGVVCGLAVFVLRGWGPGAVAGLALGCAAAAIVADRVGYLAQRGHTMAAMQALGIADGASDQLDFKVRALGVMVAWPLAALLVHVCALWVRERNLSLP